MYVLKNKQTKDGETNEEEMGELFAPSRLLRCSHVLLVAPQTQSAHHKADIFFQTVMCGGGKKHLPLMVSVANEGALRPGRLPHTGSACRPLNDSHSTAVLVLYREKTNMKP